MSIPDATARLSVLLETDPFRTAALARAWNELYLHRTGLLERYRYTGSGWFWESLPLDRVFKHLKVGHDRSSLTLIGQSSFQRLDVSGDQMREAETVALVPELNLAEVSFKYRLLFAWETQDSGIRVSAHEF